MPARPTSQPASPPARPPSGRTIYDWTENKFCIFLLCVELARARAPAKLYIFDNMFRAKSLTRAYAYTHTYALARFIMCVRARVIDLAGSVEVCVIAARNACACSRNLTKTTHQNQPKKKQSPPIGYNLLLAFETAGWTGSQPSLTFTALPYARMFVFPNRPNVTRCRRACRCVRACPGMRMRGCPLMRAD